MSFLIDVETTCNTINSARINDYSGFFDAPSSCRNLLAYSLLNSFTWLCSSVESNYPALVNYLIDPENEGEVGPIGKNLALYVSYVYTVSRISVAPLTIEQTEFTQNNARFIDRYVRSIFPTRDNTITANITAECRELANSNLLQRLLERLQLEVRNGFKFGYEDILILIINGANTIDEETNRLVLFILQNSTLSLTNIITSLRGQFRKEYFFFMSASAGNEHIFLALLASGFSPNTVFGSVSILTSASSTGNLAVLQALIKAGAVVNQADARDGTALMAAARNGHLNTVNALVEAGAVVNQAFYRDYTALMLAAMNGHLNTVNALIGAGAVVNQADARGYTALLRAAMNGHLDTMNALVDAGAVVNQAINRGVTALMFVAEIGHLNVVQALIAADADVNQTCEGGLTALILAVVNGHLNIVNALVDAEADVNQAIDRGVTALMIAVDNNNTEMVRALLAAGARVATENNNGQTALDFAANLDNNVEILDLLERHLQQERIRSCGRENNAERSDNE